LSSSCISEGRRRESGNRRSLVRCRCSLAELLDHALGNVGRTHANADTKRHERDNEENGGEGCIFHIVKLLLAVVEDGDDGESHQHDRSQCDEGGED